MKDSFDSVLSKAREPISLLSFSTQVSSKTISLMVGENAFGTMEVCFGANSAKEFDKALASSSITKSVTP